MPVGLWLGHIGRGEFLAIAISNVGRAVPIARAAGVLHRLRRAGLHERRRSCSRCWRSRRSSPTPTSACARSTARPSTPPAGMGMTGVRDRRAGRAAAGAAVDLRRPAHLGGRRRRHRDDRAAGQRAVRSASRSSRRRPTARRASSARRSSSRCITLAIDAGFARLQRARHARGPEARRTGRPRRRRFSLPHPKEIGVSMTRQHRPGSSPRWRPVLVAALALAACGSSDKLVRQPSQLVEHAGQPGQARSRTIPANASQGHDHRRLEELHRAVHPRRDLRAGARGRRASRSRGSLNLGSEQVAYKARQDRRQIDDLPGVHGHRPDLVLRVSRSKEVPKRHGRGLRARPRRTTPRTASPRSPQTPFQNTYIIASTKATADEVRQPEDASPSSSAKSRLEALDLGLPGVPPAPDCLLGLSSVYGFNGKFVSSAGQVRRPRRRPGGLHVRLRDRRQLALRQVRGTYQDDKKFFPPYNITRAAHDKTASKKLGPDGQKVIARTCRST